MRDLAAQADRHHGGRRIRYRIGINLGDVMIDGDDIYGDGVNVAARLQELAAPGGIVMSASVREQISAEAEPPRL
ncbi:MAG TPA: adenylate/guanylate cyclase domain-containing protein [Dongiaceae bacterium]|nr:adenylate/guanylate cyclase domain-containing protein [Dongiaceae bacterium]